MNINDDSQAKMNNAEVLTVVLTAARFFCGNIRNAAVFLREHGYVPDMPSESRLNRRIHAVDDSVWENLFLVFAEIFRAEGREYVIDSFPVPLCDNIRISRSKIFTEEDYRGYISFKRRYFLRNTDLYDRDRLRKIDRICGRPRKRFGYRRFQADENRSARRGSLSR